MDHVKKMVLFKKELFLSVKLIGFFSIGLLFIQCKGKEGNINVDDKKLHIKEDSIAKTEALPNDEILTAQNVSVDTSLQWLYPCDVTTEMMFFIKNGKFYKGKGKGQLRGEYSNDSLNIQVGYKDCKLLYRHIIHPNSKAYSYAKYHKGKLVSYDSINYMGENVISYMYGRSINDSLPKYLKSDIYTGE